MKIKQSFWLAMTVGVILGPLFFIVVIPILSLDLLCTADIEKYMGPQVIKCPSVAGIWILFIFFSFLNSFLAVQFNKKNAPTTSIILGLLLTFLIFIYQIKFGNWFVSSVYSYTVNYLPELIGWLVGSFLVSIFYLRNKRSK